MVAYYCAIPAPCTLLCIKGNRPQSLVPSLAVFPEFATRNRAASLGPDSVFAEEFVYLRKLLSQSKSSVPRNWTVLLRKFAERAVSQIRPAIFIHQSSTYRASCPGPIRPSLKDRPPVEHEVGAVVYLDDGMRCTEIAALATGNRHDMTNQHRWIPLVGGPFKPSFGLSGAVLAASKAPLSSQRTRLEWATRARVTDSGDGMRCAEIAALPIGNRHDMTN
jgi:hypothetical protein